MFQRCTDISQTRFTSSQCVQPLHASSKLSPQEVECQKHEMPVKHAKRERYSSQIFIKLRKEHDFRRLQFAEGHKRLHETIKRIKYLQAINLNTNSC